MLKLSSEKGQHVPNYAPTDEIWKEKVCVVGHICKGKGLEIIRRYSRQDATSEDYIFPILDRKIHRTEMQRKNRIHKVIGKVNPCLAEIGRMAGLETHLTTYVARHTFATVLKRSGVNIAIISESMGHSDIATTQIYLDSFENSQIDEAMKNLL